MNDNEFNAIGRISRRKDGFAKVTGRETYVSDVTLPRMYHARVLRSPYPHARIVSVDVSGAEALGAICLTHTDIPDITYNERQVSIPEKTYRDRRVLSDTLRHVGEGVAAATVRRNLLEKAGRMLGMDPAFLDIRDRKVFIQPGRKPWMVVEQENRECTISCGADRGDIIISEICGNNDPDTVLPLTDVVKAAAADGIELYCVAQFNAPARELMDFKTGQGQVWPDLTFGTIGRKWFSPALASGS